MNKLKFKNQGGMSLIEVLIALAVLSIGMAGMAAMHMTTLQFAHSAHFRSMATTIALDLEERLWIELADADLEGCPDVGSGDGSAVADMLTHWARDYVGGENEGDWDWSSARMLKVPNLVAAVGTPVTGTRVVQIPITLSWNEGRFETEFDDGEQTSTESFTYNIRIFCRATPEEEEEE